MDFSFTPEHEALRDTVRGMLAASYGDYARRRSKVAEAPGFDEELWRQLAAAGLLGLPFSQAYGGGEAGAVEVGIVCREVGRVIAPEPYLSSVVLAGGLVAACGAEQQRGELLGALCAGRMVLAFAHDEPGQGWTASAQTVTACEHAGSWRLTGTKVPVPHGARAEVLVVSAALPDGGTGLFLVRGSEAARTDFAAYDGTRAARVVLDQAAAAPLGEAGTDATEAIARALDLTRVIAANQALGAMEFLVSATTRYLSRREQFGVPLASFQALRFRAADLYVALELTRSMVDWATMVAAAASSPSAALSPSEGPALREAARRVGLQVSRAGRQIGQEAIQLHGGIAMTMEYSIGMYTAHLTALDHLYGDGTHHLGELARRVTEYGAIDPLD